MRRRFAALAAVLLAVAAGSAMIVLRPAYAAMACTVDYRIDREWSSGFRGELTFTNLGAPLDTWRLYFWLLDPEQRLDPGLSPWPPGVFMTSSGQSIQLRGNGPLPTGGTVVVPLNGSYRDANPAPTSFMLDTYPYLYCNSEDPTASPPRTSPSSQPPPDPSAPTVALTSPQRNDYFAAPATIPLGAVATAAPGRRITRVEFYGAGALLHTDTTPPYAFTWRGVGLSGGMPIEARAYDDTGATAMSQVRGVRVFQPGPAGSAPALKVVGNRIVTVDHAPRPYQLRGVVRAGAESRCVEGIGIWDGPVDDASIRALKAWSVNAVRILLNEQCWESSYGLPAEYSGEAYRAEVTAYVRRLIAHGITPIIALHRSYGSYTGPGADCTDDLPTCRKPMPSIGTRFWIRAAHQFGDDHAVVFDVFSEPYPDQAITDPAQAWTCWRDGGEPCAPIGYSSPGMQELIRVIRAIGGFNVVLVGGLDWSNDLSRWLAYRPADPDGRNVAAAWHVDNRAACATPACWNAQVAPVAARVPVVATEVSEDTGTHRFTDRVFGWLDGRGLGYLGSAWNTGGYEDIPPLIRDYAGTPTRYGAGLEAQLAGR